MRPDGSLFDAHRRYWRSLALLMSREDIDVNPTGYDVVHTVDNLRLLRFHEGKGDEHRVPLLINYALVNRPYILDLQEDRSVVRRLLEGGMDIYMIDWGEPDASDRYLTHEDYLNRYIDTCVERVCDLTGADAVNVLGYCMGGTFSLMYAALYPEKVRSLVTMACLVDFHQGECMLNRWAMYLDVDRIVDVLGNVPGEFLNVAFLLLDPARNLYLKYAQFMDMVDDERAVKNFLRMERWIFDGIPVAGETYREFITYGYQENRLIKGTWPVGDRCIDLKMVTMPVLNLVATRDTIIPPESSLALERHVGTSDYTLMTLDTGHIGLSVGGRAHRELWPKVAEWVRRKGR